MRENTKWIMLITAVAFVALMLFEWGMDLSGRSSAQASGGELGRVNGQPITYEEYFQVYQSLYQQQQQAQEEPISTAQNRQIEDAAWEQVVTETLIQQELRRRGITAADQEVIQAARYVPPPEFTQSELFQTDGQFDIEKYHQYLASPTVDTRLLAQLEAYYRDIIPRSKLARQVSAGGWVTDAELWRIWRDQNERATARYILLQPAALVADAAVSVSEAEVEAYYDEHEEDFERPARARVRYTAIRMQPTAADTAAALDKATTLRQEILAGADFAEVARRESSDPGSAQQGGSLGTFGRGQMVPAFDQAVWELPIGRVSEPVQTQFGFHLIEVLSREGDEAEARHILIPIEMGRASENALLTRADSLETLGEELSLQAAAERLGLTVRSGEFTPERPGIAGLGAVDEGSDWAFEEAEPGDVSPVFEGQDVFYIFELVEVTPERTLPLEEAAPLIRARLAAEKKLERTLDIGRELVDRIRGGATLEQAAQSRKLTVQTTPPFARTEFVSGLGRANAAIGTVFGLEPGEISGVVEANGNVYILQTLTKVPADREAWEQQKELQRARILASLEQQRWSQFVEALRADAEIVDLRDEVLRAPADDQQQVPMGGLF